MTNTYTSMTYSMKLIEKIVFGRGFKLHQYSVLNNGVVQLSPAQWLIWIYVSGQKPLYPFSGVTGHKLRVTGGQMNAKVTGKHSSTLCICH